MTPQTWLITGGAGYIGAHVADEFLANGKDVVIYDSLYRGLESRIQYLRKKHNKEIPLIVADIRDLDRFEDTLMKYKPYGIIHTAALKSVGESMEKPDEYFEVNHHATTKMLELITKHRIKNFIFSSTAAVYGAPDHSNPSKLAAESEVQTFLAISGNRGTSLRFFNVVGTAAPELLDNSVENLVPIIVNKLKAGEKPIIFGTDYPTPDGTCVRDYVDVRDIANAHLAVASTSEILPIALNVGTGTGASVAEIVASVCNALGCTEVIASREARRKGDPAFLCADVSLIKMAIEFSARYLLSVSIKSIT